MHGVNTRWATQGIFSELKNKRTKSRVSFDYGSSISSPPPPSTGHRSINWAFHPRTFSKHGDTYVVLWIFMSVCRKDNVVRWGKYCRQYTGAARSLHCCYQKREWRGGFKCAKQVSRASKRYRIPGSAVLKVIDFGLDVKTFAILTDTAAHSQCKYIRHINRYCSPQSV